MSGAPVINDNNYEDENSLWELIFKLRDALKYLFSRWLLLLIMCIIGAALGLTYAYLKEPVYEANLTFVLEESKSSALGAYSGIAAQFGIDLSGSSSSGVFSGDNILEFLKSRLIVEHALLSDTVLEGKRITLADLYMTVSGFGQQWKNKPTLKNVSFLPDSKPDNLSLIQDSVIQVFYNNIVKKNLVVDKPDKKLGFIQITTSSFDELFSKLFTEKLVSGAIDFYVRTKTQRSRNNVDNLQRQADSLLFLLDKKTYNLAASQDLNQNPARKVALIDEEISGRDKLLLATVYGEVIKNLEIAKMTLVQETPIIQVVDRPLLPLKKVRVGKGMGILGGGLLFLFGTCIYLMIRRISIPAIERNKARTRNEGLN